MVEISAEHGLAELMSNGTLLGTLLLKFGVLYEVVMLF